MPPRKVILPIGKEQFRTVINRILGNDASLTNLKLKKVDLGDGGFSELASALRSNSTLRSLKLSSVLSGSDDVAAGLSSLVEVAAAPPGEYAEGDGDGDAGLTNIAFPENSLGDLGTARVSEALCSPGATSIRHLNLNRNGIGPTGAESLAEMLRSQSWLNTLVLRNNQMNDGGVASILRALSNGENRSVKDLRLGSNVAGTESAKAAGLAIGTNGSLLALDLARSSIKDDGASSIAAGLQSDTCRLQSLDLRWCGIYTDGIVSLAQSLKVNSTLISLSLDDNNIKERGIDEIEEYLLNNESLIEFLHNGCRVGVKGSQRIKRSVWGSRNAKVKRVEYGKDWDKMKPMTWSRIAAQQNRFV